MNGSNGVSVKKVAKLMDLYNFLPDMDLEGHRIKVSDVNVRQYSSADSLSILNSRESRSSEM